MVPTWLTLLFFQLLFGSPAWSLQLDLVSYDNDFVDPSFIVSGAFVNTTWEAQQTIAQWATELSTSGPWSVTNKTVSPPSGDLHDYLSWAPYLWPNCKDAKNTTELSPQQIWVTCPYVTRDGEFNPDRLLVNNVVAFQNLSDAVFYGAMAWALNSQSSPIFSRNVVSYIKAWFLDPATKMNPNLNYAQMHRGPDGQVGTHTGILDLKCFVKITIGIMILRQGKSPDWTTDLDDQMNAWANEYITWLETSAIAVEEGLADNNHGTFYYNQLAALKILVNDIPGAKNVTDTYFSKQYLSQISASGEQPLEAARTRPYHYRAYNLAAMITNARLAQFIDPTSNIWNKTTKAGATIQSAVDFAMKISPNKSDEADETRELYPSVAAVAAIYGDPKGKYTAFLAHGDPQYFGEAYFLWNQPLAGGTANATASSPPSPTGSGQNGKNAGISLGETAWHDVAFATCFAVLSFVSLF
ncbi:chondroitin AC/alginate lyase [Hysterangium stoloniferum]|nr:chondroitin AC/alginate lyase [Hysterangium stoloniferum]